MRKAISLFLVFSMLLLSGNMFAKERKGADLIIQKTDGTGIRGELIAVKQSSILLIERETGADVTFDIEDIKLIIFVKEWKAGTGFLMGAISGAVLGAGVASATGSISVGSFGGGGGTERGDIEGAAFMGGLVGGVLGILIAGLPSFDKKIQFEGKSDSEIQEILEKLRKKARIRNAQ